MSRTILCLASYEKGHDFLREAKRLGWKVVLITSESIKDEARWPTESIDALHYFPDRDHRWDRLALKRAVSYLARTEVFDRIVPLDDLDLESAAMLREHLRVPGLGDSETRFFRDKLAMRVQTQGSGLRTPEFVHLLNDAEINRFADTVPRPWVVKPRFQAGSIGIRKVRDRDELWSVIDSLGDERSNFLAERYVAGNVFHVDSLYHAGKRLFSRASQYGRPVLDIVSEGDVFTSQILAERSELSQALVEFNGEVLASLRFGTGVTHSEFIRGRDDGRLYFLETSARAAGAHLATMVEAATGVNVWREWARLELADAAHPYELPPMRDEYAGILLALAREPRPDTSGWTEPEIVWRLDMYHHVGIIVRSPSPERTTELVGELAERIRHDFLAKLPPKEYDPG